MKLVRKVVEEVVAVDAEELTIKHQFRSMNVLLGLFDSKNQMVTLGYIVTIQDRDTISLRAIAPGKFSGKYTIVLMG